MDGEAVHRGAAAHSAAPVDSSALTSPNARQSMAHTMLSVTGISKSFPGVKSLQDVDFSVSAGEIHALVGENGAGKSTLIKIISGAYVPDKGEIELDGEKISWAGPREAQSAGIHVIYQELVLFPELTVAENVFINDQPLNRFGIIDYRRMERRADDALRRLGARIDARQRMKNLTVADQQMVEVARALVGSVKVLILDEPTAVISGREVDLLFDRLIALRTAGVAIIYISHRLEEIFRIADRVTILKDGVRVTTRPVTEVTRDQLISMMVGRALSDVFPPRRAVAHDAPVLLRAEGITVGTRVRDASLALKSGEVLGLAGLVGSGRTELAQAIFGGLPFDAGKVEIADKVFARTSPRSSIEAGVGLLTEDRKGEGLLMHLSVAANIVAPRLGEIARGPFIDLHAENKIGANEIARFSIAAPGPQAVVAGLSGGSQQKVLFSRWVRTCRRVLLLDEPTRGVDVGAKVEIYRIIRQLADDGFAILMISSELLEIVGMCDRALVMCEGVITGELAGSAITEEAIMNLALAG
jgi:ABC-type sugar transport system ATPase subunit